MELLHLNPGGKKSEGTSGREVKNDDGVVIMEMDGQTESE